MENYGVIVVGAGPAGLIHELIILLLNNKRFKAKVNRGFSY